MRNPDDYVTLNHYLKSVDMFTDCTCKLWYGNPQTQEELKTSGEYVILELSTFDVKHLPKIFGNAFDLASFVVINDEIIDTYGISKEIILDCLVIKKEKNDGKNNDYRND